jgi:hypothetical protein
MTRQKAIEVLGKIQSGNREEAIQILMRLQEPVEGAESSEEEESPLSPSGSRRSIRNPTIESGARSRGVRVGIKEKRVSDLPILMIIRNMRNESGRS